MRKLVATTLALSVFALAACGDDDAATPAVTGSRAAPSTTAPVDTAAIADALERLGVPVLRHATDAGPRVVLTDEFAKICEKLRAGDSDAALKKLKTLDSGNIIPALTAGCPDQVDKVHVDTVPPNTPKMTAAEFARVQTGMSLSQVIGIVGSAGEVMSSTDLGGIHTEMRSWDGEGSLGANANVMFQDGKVVSKAQYGLE